MQNDNSFMKNKGEVTIHDIAKELKISASTVSRALNNNPRISTKTKNKIKETALKMGYRPNIVASNLRTQKTNTIGVVVPRIYRNFFSNAISGMEEIAYRRGYNVIITQSGDDPEREQFNVNSLFSSRVDGIIVSMAMHTTNFDHFKLFYDKNIPIVFFDRLCAAIPTTQIVVDDENAGYQITKHLAEQGCKRIAHLAGPQNLKIYSDRRKGYERALAEMGLTIDEDQIIYCNLTREDGTKAAQTLLSGTNKPDGIYCGNDTSALSVIIYAKENNIKIPEDLCIVGLSNEPFAEVITPSLSTIKQPAVEIGKQAVLSLIDQIENKKRPEKLETIVLPTELIIRESSKRK
ncbi:LacI family transcriptional regulator [Puteibacter caeruleilacunae]|nr:LacI family transcriptional regulator [Puteibacter caeruleilacunae]